MFRLSRPAALRPIVRALAFTTTLAVVAAPAVSDAQSHRARLSRDVAERLQQRIETPTEIIVSASDAGVDQLVARYGARLKARIHGGAVLEATGGQIDAISQDADVDHIAGNARVHRMMAVTTAATGADQVWAGLDGSGGQVGRGIGVAVIDSGVAAHPALKGRVVVSMDFTEAASAKTAGSDQFGHGTHIAGIIAEGGKDGFGGMAPGAWIVNLKALGADGSGRTSDVIAAIDWAIAHRRQFNIRVINLSLGHPVFES
jgi:serine protease AprX